MRTPYQALPTASLQRALPVVVALTAALAVYLRAQGGRLEHPAAPYGIISYEFCWSLERAQEMIRGWSGQEDAVRLQIWADMPFLMLYPALFSILCELGLRRARSGGPPWAQRAGAWAVWVAWGMAPLDLAENLLLLRLLEPTAQAWMAPTASACATVKFAILGGVLVYLTASTLASRLRP